jgi:hypothetical protein
MNYFKFFLGASMLVFALFIQVDSYASRVVREYEVVDEPEFYDDGYYSRSPRYYDDGYYGPGVGVDVETPLGGIGVGLGF